MLDLFRESLIEMYIDKDKCGGGLQARVQELLFNFSGGGGPGQKIAEKMIFSTKKVANYR